MHNEQSERIKVVKLLLSLTILFVGYLILRFVYNTGQLSLQGLTGNETTLLIQGEDFDETINTASTEYSSRLSSGKYTVTVIDGLSSYVKSINIGRFLSKTTVTTALTEESKREFIAENPRSCIGEVSGIPITYTCNGPAYSLVVHLPATATNPTRTAELKNTIKNSGTETNLAGPGTIEGVVTLNNKTFLLLYRAEELGTFHSVYELSLINNTPVITFIKSLEGLGDDIYQASYYEGGLNLSNPEGSKVISGTSFDDLTILRDEEKSDAVSSDYKNGALIRIYKETKKGAQGFELPIGSSRLTIEKDEAVKETTIDKDILKASFCGDLICVLKDDNALTLFNDSLTVVATIPGVEEYQISNDALYALKNDTIIKFTPSSLEGNIIYSSDTFKLSTFSVFNGELFITIDSGKKQHLLRAGQDAPDYIDRAIAPLLNNGFINTISINKNFIYISPELGERVQNEEGIYEFDENVKNIARDSINASLSEIGGLSIDYNVRVINL